RRARHFEYYRRSFSQHFGLVPRAVGSVPSASDLRELGVRRNFRPAVAEVADRPLVGAAVLLGRARVTVRGGVRYERRSASITSTPRSAQARLRSCGTGPVVTSRSISSRPASRTGALRVSLEWSTSSTTFFAPSM